MGRVSDSRKMDKIAHEIAHHVLRHESSYGNQDQEKEADDLIQTWGFRRAYYSSDLVKRRGSVLLKAL